MPHFYIVTYIHKNLYTYIQLLFFILFQHSDDTADGIGGGSSGLGLGQGHTSQELMSI